MITAPSALADMAEQTPPDLRVIHVGPAIGTQGGMAAVIEELCSATAPGVIPTDVPTWWPAAPVRSGAAALALVARLPVLRNRVDVVHAHLSEGGSFLREGAVVMAARALGFRTAVTLHGADLPADLRAHPRRIRTVLAAADVVFCLGTRTRAAVDALLPGRAVTVGNPIRPRPAPGAAPSGAPSVLFAGVIGTRKGFDLLLAAWPSVLERCPGASLHVAGPLDDLPLPGGPGVVYHGVLSRGGVQTLLTDATVACLPSRREVLPMFVLEALAAGVPVVASDAGELGDLEACDAVRILPNPLDPAALADALVTAIRSTTAAHRAAAYRWAADTAFAPRVVERLRRGYSAPRRSRSGVPVVGADAGV